MINWNLYDNVINKIDKQKTWIDTQHKQLYSREITYRPYTTIGKQYDLHRNCNNYFIILSDSPPIGLQYCNTKVDNYGRFRISLRSIWKDISVPKEPCNVELQHIECNDDSDVYYLDV